MRGHDREEQSSGAGELFASPAANIAIVVPDTQKFPGTLRTDHRYRANSKS
jgi:hypothetical protein